MSSGKEHRMTNQTPEQWPLGWKLGQAEWERVIDFLERQGYVVAHIDPEQGYALRQWPQDSAVMRSLARQYATGQSHDRPATEQAGGSLWSA